MPVFVFNWIELDSAEEGEHFDLTEDNEEVFQCPICFKEGEVGDATHYRTGCNHDFCLDCLKKWCTKATSCPCCRGEFKDADKHILIEKPKKLGEIVRALIDSDTESVSTSVTHSELFGSSSDSDNSTLYHFNYTVEFAQRHGLPYFMEL